MKKNIYILEGEEMISTLFPDLESPWRSRKEIYLMSINIDLKNIQNPPKVKINND